MTTVVLGMLFALALALAVVALVAVPARREGRELLTPQGEQLVQTAKERTAEVASAALDKTVEVAGAARDKTVEVAGAARDKTVEVAGATRERVAERLTPSSSDPRDGSAQGDVPAGAQPRPTAAARNSSGPDAAELDLRGEGVSARDPAAGPDVGA